MDKDLFSETASKNAYNLLNAGGWVIAIVYKRKQPGFARPKFAVTTPGRKKEIIAIVNSFDEIGPAMSAYHERNPPQWRLQSDNVYFLDRTAALGHQRTLYVKEGLTGPLYVDEISPKQWVVYRGEQECELLFGDKTAVFRTPEEAQRTADAHLRDDYPNSTIINDGYRWVPDDNRRKMRAIFTAHRSNPRPVRQGKRKSKG